MRKSVCFAMAAAVCCLAGVATAQPCYDLRDLQGNFDQSSWGRPNTVIYAQSVEACGNNVSEVRVRGTHRSGNDIMFNLVITGTHARGGGLGQEPDFNDIRYTSSMQTIPVGGGLTEVTINPNQSVTDGELVWFVFEAFSYPNSGVGTMRATQFNGQVDQYPPGEFVFANLSGQNTLQDFNNATWGHRSPNNEDLALLVEFEDGGPSCNYITKKYKQKKCVNSGCPTERVDECEYDSDEACEGVRDCAKKVKLKSGCADPDEKGKCKHILSRCDCK